MIDSSTWDKQKQRLLALWENEIVDRPCISVSAWKKDARHQPEPMPDNEADLLKWFTDPEWLHRRMLHRVENTWYGGESRPIFWSNFGTAGHAKYFKGSRFAFTKDTVWYGPSLEAGETPVYEGLGGFLKTERDCLAWMAREGAGRYFVSLTDNCGILDGLEHLRGANDLLMDLLDDPDWVKDACRIITDGWLDSYDTLHAATRDNNDGGSTHGWMHTWSPGRMQQLQVDFSVMLSPDMYAEFAMPELRRLTEWLDHSVYHLDGQEQIRHLDHILSLERLNMIQWTPVAGQPPTSDFLPVLRRIQQAGKGLVLFPKKRELGILMENLSPRGVMLCVNDAADEDEARAIVRMAEAWKEPK